MRLEQYEWSDAVINNLILERGELVIEITDWQSTRRRIRFIDHVGFEAFGVIGAEILSITRSDSSPLIERACRIAGEMAPGKSAYVFASAWGDEPVLTVIAADACVDIPTTGPQP